ncbi:MAG: PIN domain-containing protein, partial [Clostridiales bacterium]|nr:PIN domain-containing protein [Clostridiales bacterium]
MKLVDTNILLRYLLNDHPEMSAKAKEIMLDDEVLLLAQVVAEAVYVLGGVYKIERPEIADALRTVFSLETVQLENSEIVLLTVDEYAKSKLDFVDLLLFAHHQITGLVVETFDKPLLKKLQSVAPD